MTADDEVVGAALPAYATRGVDERVAVFLRHDDEQSRRFATAPFQTFTADRLTRTQTIRLAQIDLVALLWRHTVLSTLHHQSEWVSNVSRYTLGDSDVILSAVADTAMLEVYLLQHWLWRCKRTLFFAELHASQQTWFTSNLRISIFRILYFNSVFVHINYNSNMRRQWRHSPHVYNRKAIPLSHLRGSSRGSLRCYKYFFCRRKAAVVLRKVGEGLRFDCSRYGSFAVFAVCLRFPAGFCGLNRISMKVV